MKLGASFTRCLFGLLISGGVATPLFADDVVEEVQLDMREPSERIISRGEQSAVLVWNPELKNWIELFVGASPITIGSPKTGGFADLRSGQFIWVWEGGRYVPRLPANPPLDYSDLDAETLEAVRAFAGAAVPPSTGAVAYDDKDGSNVQFVVLDQNGETCMMDGLVCRGVVVRDGEIAGEVAATVGYGFRISEVTNQRGHRLIEQGSEAAIRFIDPDTGELVHSLEAAEVKISPFQPDPPQ